MFSIFLKLKRRIKRLLKVRSEARMGPHPSVQARSVKFGMLMIVSLLVAAFYPADQLYDPLDVPRVGEVVQESILAPFEITVNKTPREYREDVEEARRQTPFIVDYDSTIVRQSLAGLDRFVALVDSLKKAPNYELLLNENQHVRVVAQRFPQLSETAITKAFRNDSLSRVRNDLRQIYSEQIYRIGVMPDDYALPDGRNKLVLIRGDQWERMVGQDRLSTVFAAFSRLLTAVNNLSAADAVDTDLYYSLGRSFIAPNLRINSAEYERRLHEAEAQVSRVLQVVAPGEVIVESGRRINDSQERVLRAMVRIQREQAAEEGYLLDLTPVAARILLVLAVFSLLFLFLHQFRRDVYRSNPKLLAVLLVFVLQLVLTYLAKSYELTIYLYPVALLPILMAMLFDVEVSILSTLALALLLGIMHRFDFNLALMTFTVGTAAAFASQNVRRRSHFFRTWYLTAFAFILYAFVVETLRFTPNEDILTDAGLGALTSLITIFLVIGLLPVFESVFGITTNITLLELSDFNHPLLKRLAVEAPGTFHHSIVVGTLSEAAAEAIGGNPLLARVGAYFHDIGKIEIPEYFVENQLSVKSKHEELTPTMSSIVLSSHVKLGRKLGEEADIPDDVLNFIEEHHGTMVQSYFYNKALERGATPDAIDKFRYPGPRPQTRETAIAMLADAVEAASRTLEDPKPARLNNLIQRIINDRFQSGEFDECPLTLRDLNKIKHAFTQILIGTFHQRIAYPKKGKDDDE